MVEQLRDEGSPVQVVVAAASAGLLSRFVIAPLDVIKIRLQLQSHSLSDPLSHRAVKGPVYSGIFPTLKDILRDEGITALWNGNIPAEGLYMTYSAVQFLAYRTTNQLLTSQPFINPRTKKPYLNEYVRTFITGGTAGVAATTVAYPLDLLRTRFAAQGTRRVYSSLWGGIRDIRRVEGMRGFFRGLVAANVAIVPYMGIFFSSYEILKPMLNDNISSVPIVSTLFAWFGAPDAIAGVLAGIIAKSATYPLDTVRKRLQVQGPSRKLYVHGNIPEYLGGVVPTFRVILKREGVRGLYRGLTVALAKAAPASAVTMWTFERVMMGLQYLEDKKEQV